MAFVQEGAVVMRLVDIERFPLLPNKLETDESEYERGYHDATDNLNAIPTVDAVPVVRCRECKWYEKSVGLCNWCSSDITRNFRDEDDFCSYGERRC